MIALILFVYNLIFQKRKFLYLLGIIIILINNYLLFHNTSYHFSGSDSTSLYRGALLIKNNFDIINQLEFRYFFYFLYQNILTYPFLDAPNYASILIKISNWSIFFYCFDKLSDFLKSNNTKYKFLITSIYLMGLWLSLYNFRDILILSLTIISTIYFLKSENRKLFASLFILFFLRGFIVLLFVFSYFLSNLIINKKNKSIGGLKILIILFFLLISSQFYTTFSYIIYEFLFLSNIFQVKYTPSIIESNLIFSLLAGNPMYFLFEFFSGYERAFFISTISAVLISFIYLVNYLLIFNVFGNLVSGTSINSSLFGIKKISLRRGKQLLYILLLSFFFTAIAYNFEVGGVQERIRINLLFYLLLIYFIIEEKKSYTSLFYLIALISMILIFISKSL